MNAAVIGAGNGGRALAAFLRREGWEVTLYNRPDPAEVAAYLQPLAEAGGIQVEGVVEGFVTGVRLTTDLIQAITEAQWVFVVTPAFAHRALAAAMAPHVPAAARIVLMPGRTLGAWEFALQLRRHGGARVMAGAGTAAGPVVAETHSLPFACRLRPGPTVRISGIKRWLLLGALPAAAAPGLLAELAPLLPGLRAAPSILETGLCNFGAMIHPATTLLNAARVEQLGGGYPFYREGVTPAVARVIGALDAERLQIARAWNADVPSLLQATCDSYGVCADDLYTALRATPAYEVGEMPGALSHRYVLEDVPNGLVPLAALGRAVGIPAPTVEGILQLAEVMVGQQVLAEGRHLERLGLDGLSPAGVRALLTVGPAMLETAPTTLSQKEA